MEQWERRWFDLAPLLALKYVFRYPSNQAAAALEQTTQRARCLSGGDYCNGDAAYLALLEETKRAIGPQHRLSIAANDWLPTRLNWLPVLGGYKWSDDYIRMVAERVDQLAVMTYDSFMPTDWLYRLWLREQVRGLGRGLTDSRAELLIGVSVSRESTSTHRPVAENLRSGLSGVCAGIAASSDARRVVSGVAIYASWEADETDWQVWQDWLQAR